ncbi:hypothetical protein BFG60_1805 [Microcystis aeruginosa NIES-98]|nr:hypothetical protein BFG60_1805 [Microcystis aeruginosa NIES-98]
MAFCQRGSPDISIKIIQCDRIFDNPTTNPQLLMIADESLIIESNEQSTQSYPTLIRFCLIFN